MQKFLRRIEVEIVFSQKNDVIKEKNLYVSTGLRDGLAISFSVSKTYAGSPNESTISILNMSPESRQKIVSNVDKVAVKLYAYYEGDERTLLASGNLLKAWPEKEGTTNKMTLTFLDGISAILIAKTNRSFPPNTKIKDVVVKLAKDMEEIKDVKVDSSKINVDGEVGSRGLSINGRTSSALDSLANQYGFTWSIQNGVFQAYRDKTKGDESSRKKYVISVKENNLLKASPELGEKYMQQIGMKIEAILNAKICPGDIVDLTSTVYPQYSSEYIAHNIDFYGDTFGPDWKMVIESKQAAKK